MAGDDWSDSVDHLSRAIDDANVHGYFGAEPELAEQRRLCPRTRTIAHYLGAESLRLLKEPVIRGSDIRNLYIRHDRDFDLELFIDNDADPEVVEHFGERLVARADILLLTAKMIGDLLGLIVAVARRVAVTAWFGLLLALIELRASFSDLRRYSAQEVELMAELDALRT